MRICNEKSQVGSHHFSPDELGVISTLQLAKKPREIAGFAPKLHPNSERKNGCAEDKALGMDRAMCRKSHFQSARASAQTGIDEDSIADKIRA